MFEYVFTKILMANYGQLASAIFNGDFMISQQGIDNNGNASSDYTSFNSENGSFTPNILINFLTGTIKSRLMYSPISGVAYSNNQHTINPNVDGNYLNVTCYESGNTLNLPPNPENWLGLHLYLYYAIPYTRVPTWYPTLAGSMVVDGYIVNTYNLTAPAEFYSDGLHWCKM